MRKAGSYTEANSGIKVASFTYCEEKRQACCHYPKTYIQHRRELVFEMKSGYGRTQRAPTCSETSTETSTSTPTPTSTSTPTLSHIALRPSRLSLLPWLLPRLLPAQAPCCARQAGRWAILPSAHVCTSWRHWVLLNRRCRRGLSFCPCRCCH